MDRFGYHYQYFEEYVVFKPTQFTFTEQAIESEFHDIDWSALFGYDQDREQHMLCPRIPKKTTICDFIKIMHLITN